MAAAASSSQTGASYTSIRSTRQQSAHRPERIDLSLRVWITVNEWMADIDAEDRQANVIPAYQHTVATTKDTLSNIFAPALLPLLDDDSVSSY